MALVGLVSVGCGGGNGGEVAEQAATTEEVAPSLGIRPNGDTELQPDLTQVSDELKQVYDYIDEHIDEHVITFQRWIQQPSISNTGEGIPESAQMVKGFFDQLGCQQSQVYEVGETEWGSQGNPVVYAKCDEGAERTLLIYWMYDTMPITQPDLWNYPPFAAELVEQPPFPKVLIGRGATNSKGPQMAQWNAFMSIKAVHGKLPVYLIVVAEGEEEGMSIGLRQFVKDHPELFADADAMYRFGGLGAGGGASLSGGSEGCVYIELTTGQAIDTEAVAVYVERRFRDTNMEYESKRASGRLQELEVVQLKPGAGEAYKLHYLAAGQRESQFKPVILQYQKDFSFDILAHCMP